MITHILFDVDDTLLDYQRAEAFILDRLFAECGRQLRGEELAEAWRLSWAYWDAERLSDTDAPEVQREYHERYHRSVQAYCGELSRRHGLGLTAAETYRRFNLYLGQAVTMYDDTLEVLDALKERGYVLCAATNGLACVQRPRVGALGGRIDRLFCSEELGVVKPMEAFFARVLEETGVRAEQCLMVGDSLTSDILGAKRAGMKAIWVNRTGREPAEGAAPDEIVENLTEILSSGLLTQEG